MAQTRIEISLDLKDWRTIAVDLALRRMSTSESFLWPGLGQMYKGQVLMGFAWWFIVLLGYAFCLVPGFFLHVICVFDAASGSEG
jgi:hypothetical protein